LRLNRTTITDTGLAFLRDMPKLGGVSADKTFVSKKALAELNLALKKRGQSEKKGPAARSGLPFGP
jgi:hypothetical protein